MRRRDFVASAVAGVAGMMSEQPKRAVAASTSGSPPNILFIIVDQMRYPTVFPHGIANVGEFLSRIMPNVHERIWKPGVKFANHFSAATPCSPARGVLTTGLYSQQTWILDNVGEYPFRPTAKESMLNPGFPTYGKLLRRAGYQTPYVGKWHLSVPPANPRRLDAYGFDDLTYPDPIGENLQGTVGDPTRGFLSDEDIVNQAKAWLAGSAASTTPWCLTVSFIDPHDIEYFWGGTEFRTYNQLFDNQDTFRPERYFSINEGRHYPPVVPWPADPIKEPPSYGYPELPPNWEPAAQIRANKPPSQADAQLHLQLGSGGASDDPKHDGYTIIRYRDSKLGIAKAPYSYWRRVLDCYTQLMATIDQRIGEVLDALPAGVASNTVLVFTSDHGNYSGAHGFLTGKTGSLYDEAFHVPLVVTDPSGRFTDDVDTLRTGLTSSVDVVPMLASLGHNGQSGWMTADLAQAYGSRHDMISMLRSAAAAGRDYVLLASDQDPPSLAANSHLLGLRTEQFKLGTYAQWPPGTTTVVRASLETEFYDYGTAEGSAEIANTPDDPRAGPTLDFLLGTVIADEVQAPLSGSYFQAQTAAQQDYLAHSQIRRGAAHQHRQADGGETL